MRKFIILSALLSLFLALNSCLSFNQLFQTHINRLQPDQKFLSDKQYNLVGILHVRCIDLSKSFINTPIMINRDYYRYNGLSTIWFPLTATNNTPGEAHLSEKTGDYSQNYGFIDSSGIWEWTNYFEAQDGIVVFNTMTLSTSWGKSGNQYLHSNRMFLDIFKKFNLEKDKINHFGVLTILLNYKASTSLYEEYEGTYKFSKESELINKDIALFNSNFPILSSKYNQLAVLDPIDCRVKAGSDYLYRLQQ